MSFGIVRIQKFTAGSVRGIDIHDNRVKDKSHSNPDIDFSKSADNYKLVEQDKSFYGAVQDRIKGLDLPKAVRKDAVVMAQALVTSDKAFFDGMTDKDREAFFKRSYEFIRDRYGEDNIISATVHLDEKTPHMHVNFVPVTADGRLCAKDVLNRKEMQSLQNDAFKDVFEGYGLERGESREDKRRHLSTEEFKAATASERVKELEALEKETRDRVTKLKAEAAALDRQNGEQWKQNADLRAINGDLEAKRAGLEAKIKDGINFRNGLNLQIEDARLVLSQLAEKAGGKQTLAQKLAASNSTIELERFKKAFNRLTPEQQQWFKEQMNTPAKLVKLNRDGPGR